MSSICVGLLNVHTVKNYIQVELNVFLDRLRSSI